MSNTTKANADKVTEAVNATKVRLDGVKVKLAEVRQVMADARSERDQAISDAEKAHSDAYNTGRTDQQNELRALDEGYAVLREEITSRFEASQSALSEARDTAVTVARETYERTQEAAKLTFGDNV
jgi:uncharacterized coiled-coil DUF342 family protein